MTTTPLPVGFLVALVVASTLIGIAGPPAAAASTGSTPAATSGSCMTVVEHDAFRENETAMSQLSNGTATTSTVSNTRVTIDESGSFYELTGENPNGYCVTFRVFVSEQAMPPASIPGDVDSNDGNHTATWDSIHDFNASETYTVIEFTLPAATTATFSPNQYRVKALSWATRQESTAQSVYSRMKESVLGEQPVTKRHYRIDVSDSEAPTTVTVRLRNPQTGAKISEYHALYSTDGGDSWRPVPTETNKPVYKHEPANRSVVRFTFNEGASVKFVANPSTVDDAKREYASYMAGVDQILDDYLGGIFGDDTGGENGG